MSETRLPAAVLDDEIRRASRSAWIFVAFGACIAIAGVALLASSGNVIAIGNKPTTGTMVAAWGLIFLVFGFLSWWRAPRYYRRLARIYRTGQPQAMTLTIQTKKAIRGDLYYDATLSAPNVQPIAVRVDSECLEGPGFEQAAKVRSLKLMAGHSIDWPEPVKVYRAGDTGPVLIEVDGSLLWPESDIPGATRRAKKR